MILNPLSNTFLLLLFSITEYHLRIYGYGMQYRNSYSDLHLANEYEMVQPSNIHYSINTENSRYIISNIDPVLIKNDDIVTISFYSNKPHHLDWIAAYAPSSVHINATVPVKYGYCHTDSNYLSTGYGSMKFQFTNLRSDIAFYIFSNGTAHPILRNISTQLVDFHNRNEPLRPRVVTTGDPDIFNLLWSSYSSTKPKLKWGTQSGVYDNVIEADTSSITQDEMCGAPANSTGWRDLGMSA
jgi:hypothetical protein